MTDPDVALTIGQFSRRTGLPVRTIRHWSDVGVLPPAGRSEGGYRLYDAESVARAELISTLRELGLGLDDVRRVLEREVAVADVAAVHLKALDAQMRTLRLRRAVLGAVAKRRSPLKEMALLHKLARLSAEERRQIIEDFVRDVFGDVDADPRLPERMRVPVDLPDDPTPEQVDAWVELADLVADPDFRATARRVAEQNAAGRPKEGPGSEPGAFLWFAKKVTGLVGPAREAGVAPGSPQAAEVVDRLLGPSADREAVLERLEASSAPAMERYWRLLAIVAGKPVPPSRSADFAWLAEALRAQARR
ncbi:MerR family transcriptional regulator [Actinomadura sp. NBRC 104412]|uniref:helix-turn-helix domain-containing protein n=1 Tax=Actinomadura sp. NBRC 104412 TaxID=3032203 RepID=UPI0024A10E1E|nr:MerR family transcriptional regulator [Actinomadura sp. NBRC 104412]GLZ05872.1 MerR family transcriptional regulator [Actinomadura sp. NBRC 104412]